MTLSLAGKHSTQQLPAILAGLYVAGADENDLVREKVSRLQCCCIWMVKVFASKVCTECRTFRCSLLYVFDSLWCGEEAHMQNAHPINLRMEQPFFGLVACTELYFLTSLALYDDCMGARAR